MNANRVLQLVGIVLGFLLLVYLVRFGAGYFANVTFLGGLLFLEILIACIWRYEGRFFLLLIIAFAWAGMNLPLQGTWTAARWAALATGAAVGFILWMKKARTHFSSFHLLASFCVCSAFVSATVSQLPETASSKALSLFLLFLYGSGGARAAAHDREDRFFRGLLWGCEIAVYASAISYFALGRHVWGNPNSLGAVMSVAVFPVLLWGWFNSDSGMGRRRRLAALLLCAFLVFFSTARAAMAAIVLVTLAFCFGARQYRLLLKVAVWALFMIAAAGIVNPEKLSESASSVKDSVLYKGHKDEGVLGSRRTPWEKTVANIKQHPWFGTGYGTSPTGENPGFGSGKFSSSAETAREHGSSYMTVLEWVGFIGVLPFVALMAFNALHILKVLRWMRRTESATHDSVPLAMVLLAGFVHAGFEDWMFAVGYYLCVYFWALAFVLADHIPAVDKVPLARPLPGVWRPAAVRVGAVAPGR